VHLNGTQLLSLTEFGASEVWRNVPESLRFGRKAEQSHPARRVPDLLIQYFRATEGLATDANGNHGDLPPR
jgi:hypothetical protein